MLEIIFAIEAGIALGFSIYNLHEMRRLERHIDYIFHKLIEIWGSEK